MTHSLTAQGGASGIFIGRAFCYHPAALATAQAADDPTTALARLQAAQQQAAAELQTLADQLHAEGHPDEAAIFEAQAMLAEDSALTDEVAQRLRGDAGEPLSLADALAAAVDSMRAALAALDDEYLRERASDMEAIGKAVYTALYGGPDTLQDLPPDTVLIAPDLTPAETIHLRGSVGSIAFVTAHGGNTGHTAILARSLGIPALVGAGEGVLAIPDGCLLIVDGDAKRLLVEPDETELAAYRQQIAADQQAHSQRSELRDQPGQFADGQRVKLWANIGSLEDITLALAAGAEGIGLFRSELLFLERTEPPSEDEQYAVYRTALELLDGRTVVVRTLDIGGDKALPYLALPHEANPFLGVRGIRLSMQHPQMFQAQLRALLRAAVAGDLWIMLPMVATLADLRWGRAQLQQAAAALAAEGTPHRADVPLGAMVETPAVAITADLLAREAAFFSVGSNDLTQYTMAVDRGLEDLAAAYPHDSLAVLRMIDAAARAANEAGIPIGVCGELGGVPDVAPLLAGMGVHELSMAPALLPLVKERLRGMTFAEAQQAARARLAGAG